MDEHELVTARAGAHPGRGSRPPGAAGSPRRGRTVVLLAAVELLTAASAVYGGVGLIADDAIGMPDAWLASTPFGSWVLPGALLLLVVALPMGAAGVLELRGHPAAALASTFAGGAQVAWIAVQQLVVQRYDVLQPVMALVGLLVLALSGWARRHEPLVPPRSSSAGRRRRLRPGSVPAPSSGSSP